MTVILIFAILSFFSFCRGGGARPPSQVLGEGARPADPPLVAPLYICHVTAAPALLACSSHVARPSSPSAPPPSLS